MLTAPIIATIIVDIASIAIGLFAFLSNPRRTANRLVLAITIISSISLFAQNVGEFADPLRVVFWARLDSGLSMTVNVLLLLLASNFPRKLFSKRTEAAYWLISIAMIAVSVTPFMIADGTSQNGTVALVTGSLMPLYYIADTIYTLMFIPALMLQYKRGGKIDKLRVKYLIIYGGVLAISVSVIGLWLPIFFHIYQAVDFVPYIGLLALGLITYDIVALRLFTIRFVVARSVAYVLLLLFFAGGYYILALQAGNYVFNHTVQIPQAEQLYQVVIALGLAFLFQPLRRMFEKFTNNLFYREHYDTQELVNGFSRILVSERDIKPLLQQSITYLCDNLHIKSGRALVYSDNKVFATAWHQAQPLSKSAQAELPNLSSSTIQVSEELAEEDATRIFMDKYNLRVSVPLVSHNEYIGLLLLDDKLSGDVYTNQDINALEIIRQELAIAIQNARAYRQLKNAKAALEQLDEMKSEFIALSSHNLRTPLTIIKSISGMLSDSRLPDQAHEYVKTLSNASAELGDLIEELLAISTIEAGSQFKAAFEEVAVDTLLQPLADQAKTKTTAKGVKFELEIKKNDLKIMANPKHLQIVIKNLLDNAIKFTNKGKITVTVQAEDRNCIIKISDTGVGMSNESVKHLFTKFHRGTDYLTYNYTGVGVGLYLAKLVIEEHNGQIEVSSQEQKGTIITVQLPLMHKRQPHHDQ
jgi:signal transduction histidine kinase